MKFYMESSLVLSENLNKHFQFPLEICVYGKALLQRHLAITQVYHLYLPKRTPHIFLATFTGIYCFFTRSRCRRVFGC